MFRDRWVSRLVVDPVNITEEAVDTLNLYDRNVRSGDLGAICESIRAHGFVSVVVANTRGRMVLVGNHRLLAARELGIESVPVMWVDLDDDAALRLNLSDNATSDKAGYSDNALAALLTDLAQATPLGLDGTGFDGNDLDALLADLAQPIDPPPPSDADDPQGAVTEVEHVCPGCGLRFSERPAKRGLFRR